MRRQATKCEVVFVHIDLESLRFMLYSSDNFSSAVIISNDFSGKHSSFHVIFNIGVVEVATYQRMRTEPKPRRPKRRSTAVQADTVSSTN
jgi:hypothetical protein